MASRMRSGQVDIHGYERRLERAVQFLKAHREVSNRSKQKILHFLERLKAEGLSYARQTGYVQRLTAIALMLGKEFDDVDKQDIERLMKTVNAKDWAEWTKDNYRVRLE